MVSLALLSMAIVGSLTTYPMLAKMSRSTRLWSQALFYAESKADSILRLAALPQGQQQLPPPWPVVEYVGATGASEVGSINDVSATDVGMTRQFGLLNDGAPNAASGMYDVLVKVSWTDSNQTTANGASTHTVTLVFSIP